MRRAGSSRSEGGFADGRYAAASVLDVSTSKDKKGRGYYQYEVLVRSADGDEGGRHQLIKSCVGSDGNLYILKFQVIIFCPLVLGNMAAGVDVCPLLFGNLAAGVGAWLSSS